MDDSYTSGNHDLAEFEHALLTQEKTSIRLIKISQDLSKDHLIQCRVIHATLPPPFIPSDEDLDEASLVELEDERYEALPSYSCVSYTWGDPLERYAIRLNDKLFYVRSNLWEFLSMATSQLYDTFLWIDALCIDQNNTTERNHQVQQMGNIFTKAKTVLAWLGHDLRLATVLHTVSMVDQGRAMATYTQHNEGAVASSKSQARSRYRDPIASSYTPFSDASGTAPTFATEDERFNIFQDSTGKVEKLLENITEHEYWSRAWVTQEVLLAQRTVLVAGGVTCDLFRLAIRFRAAVPYFRENAFENIVDILIRRKTSRYDNVGLESWGVINLLHRFRNKKCAIRRDRIYSLLALSKEGKNLTVDYDIPEEHLMRQVLSLRNSSMCFCSTAVVSHALSPWEFAPDGTTEEERMFVETHMYACPLSSAVCPFCSNWVPFSWTRKKGLLFCLGSACPDTQGHLFWEQSTSTEETHTDDQGSAQISASIFAQSRQNNKSQLLCIEGAGIEIKQSDWKHVYLLRFTFRSLVEILQEELTTTETGLNACKHLWPNASSSAATGDGRLRFCDAE
ncbi:Nn.00g029350.m01.CDS01 [Neocucurbitaria sp. VM-36]